jgi:NAD(P)-dependent dehydrogenase (short-subunit alcohol dehydrogenase family)
MRAQGSGVIINIITASESQARNKAAYITSMYGLVGLTRSASGELSPYGIHVHAVGSGLEEFQQGDKAVPSELIEAVCFLCGSSLSGQIVNVEEK